MIYSPSSQVYMTFFFQMNTVGVLLNALALPSFIMAVNGGWDFEAQKSASIHHKKYSTQHRGVNKGLLKWIDVFHKKNINLKLYKA